VGDHRGIRLRGLHTEVWQQMKLTRRDGVLGGLLGPTTASKIVHEVAVQDGVLLGAVGEVIDAEGTDPAEIDGVVLSGEDLSRLETRCEGGQALGPSYNRTNAPGGEEISLAERRGSPFVKLGAGGRTVGAETETAHRAAVKRACHAWDSRSEGLIPELRETVEQTSGSTRGT